MTAVRHALRRLRRSPVFTAAAVLSLALGIGATTALFSLVDGVLLRPLPYPHAERLVALSHTLQVPATLDVDQSDATFLHYHAHNHTLAGIGAWQAVAVNAGDQPAEHMVAARMTASAFDVLGAEPLAGRTFRADEDVPGGAPAVVLSEGLWRRRYAADRRAVGQYMDVDGVRRQIVGIMPSSFRFPTAATQLWIPAAFDAAHTASTTFDFGGIARLAPGVSVDAAAADLTNLLPGVPDEFPGRLTTGAIAATKMRAVVRPLRDVMVGDIAHVLWPIFGGTALLLLVACANVASLLLVRATARRRDTSIRRALGAGRSAIALDLLAEAAVLAGLGAVLGVGIASAGIGVLRSTGGGITIPRLDEVGLDAVVLLVTAGIALLVTLAIGLLPLLMHRDETLFTGSSATRGATAGRGMQRALRGLVVAQVALALMLVTAAGLMARSFARLAAVEPGFTPENGYTFRVALGDATAPPALVSRIADDLASQPGIRAAGAVSRLPLEDDGRSDSAAFIEGRALPMGQMPGIHQVVFATPGAFVALGIPVREGRAFAAGDSVLETVVTQAFATRYWGAASALGRQFRLGRPNAPLLTVVGVTGDLHASKLEGDVDQVVFAPMPAGRKNVAFVVRTANGVDAPGIVRRVMRDDAPGLPAYRGRPLEVLVADASSRTRFTLRLLGVASATALLLGSLGYYGVLAYVVSLRRRELAVRLALGARPGDVRGMVARQGAQLAGAGIVAGIVAALIGTRVLAGLLFGIAATDPATLAVSAAIIMAVSAVASWIPANRAARVDPAEAMRED